MSENQALQALLCAHRHAIHEGAVEFSQLECENWRIIEIYTNHSFMKLYNLSKCNNKEDLPRFSIASSPRGVRPWQQSHHPEVQIKYVDRACFRSVTSIRFKCLASLKRLYLNDHSDVWTVIPVVKAPQLINALRFLFPKDKHHAVNKLERWIAKTMGATSLTQ